MEAVQVVSVRCPYCGEPIELLVDGSVSVQEYVEDCQVCCRPILVRVDASGEEPKVSARGEDE